MDSRPPISPNRQDLPFQDSPLSWDTFEDFFCDFLNAQPTIVVNDGFASVEPGLLQDFADLNTSDDQDWVTVFDNLGVCLVVNGLAATSS